MLEMRTFVMCLQADCLPDPSDVFSYLIDHNIGQDLALFYIAYATFCELKKNYTLADNTYQKGIEMKAAPVDRLEQKFSEFQHRMVRRIQRKAAMHQEKGNCDDPAQPQERRGLKTLRGSGVGLAAGKRRNTTRSNTGSSSIPVFVDEEFSASSVRKPIGAMALAGHQESQKENLQAAMPWVGQKIRQKSSARTIKPQTTLVVMEDPELACSTVSETNHPKHEHTLRQRLEKDVLEEQLSSDPLALVQEHSSGQEKSISPFEQSVKVDECLNEDITIGTSDAYKAMNCLFTGDARSLSLPKESSEITEFDRTMTINTRDALNAVNSMFKSSFSVSGAAEEGEIDNGLQVHEDTVFISAGEHDKKELAIREDTILLSSENLGSTEHGESPGFMIREDTVFISGDGRDENSIQSPQDFAIREDTVFIADRADITSDEKIIVGGNEDENCADLDETVAIEQETLHGEDGGVNVDVENDENAVPDGLVQIANRERKHNPLAPLDSDDIVANEIQIVPDEEAEESLAVQASDIDGPGDSFAVFEDPVPEIKYIDPFDASFQRSMIASLNPPVSEWPCVHRLAESQANLCEQVMKKGSGDIDLNIEGFHIKKITGKIGCGAYASVYGGISSDGSEIALKLEYPPCPWEWLLCKALEGRVAPEKSALLGPSMMLLSENFSVIVMPKGEHGTLQDLLNRFLGASLQMDQSMTAKISLGIFMAMKQLHESKIVHNDIKPDNILCHVAEEGNDVTVSLIDIGRGVDLELLPSKTVLFGDSSTESFRCVEMREHTPWLWQADTYAVACVIHCMIFGQYMEVDRVKDEMTGETFIRSRSKLPRTYDKVWEDVFKALLNCSSVSPETPPDWRNLCMQMENLLAKTDVAKRLQTELKKLSKLSG